MSIYNLHRTINATQKFLFEEQKLCLDGNSLYEEKLVQICCPSLDPDEHNEDATNTFVHQVSGMLTSQLG
jgi:hypothetical protein